LAPPEKTFATPPPQTSTVVVIKMPHTTSHWHVPTF